MRTPENVCCLCGDKLQRWEIACHDDCAEKRGFTVEIDQSELSDERIERAILRDDMRPRPRATVIYKSASELTDAEIASWADDLA